MKNYTKILFYITFFSYRLYLCVFVLLLCKEKAHSGTQSNIDDVSVAFEKSISFRLLLFFPFLTWWKEKSVMSVCNTIKSSTKVRW